MKERVSLSTPLSLRTSFVFPVQNAAGRREVLIGAALLLIPFVGWILNMGHRIMMVHRMMHGSSASPAWREPVQLFRHGMITFVGMVMYYIPASICAIVWVWTDSVLAAGAGIILFIGATIAIPGYMSHYCVAFDASEIFHPTRALRRCIESGPGYWHAWIIAIAALLLSFVGLLGFGILFLATSVWFWQVAGFSFATVMSQSHRLVTASDR